MNGISERHGSGKSGCFGVWTTLTPDIHLKREEKKRGIPLKDDKDVVRYFTWVILCAKSDALQREYMGYIEQPLKMELYGNFDAYYSFLLDLEQMPRITKIRELVLKKDKEHEGMTTAEFVVSIFFQGAQT